MYMTLPETMIGSSKSVLSQDDLPDPGYLELRLAYGPQVPQKPPRADLPIPVLAGSASLVAGDVAERLLSRREGPRPEALIDCRSSTMVGEAAPTYRVMAACGLNQASCWSLSGAGGSEAAFAIVQVRQLGIPIAVVTATQVISHPDTRTVENGYPLGDAAAALYLSRNEPNKGFFWRIRSCCLGHVAWQNDGAFLQVKNLIENACQEGQVSADQLNWQVAQAFSAPFLDSITKALPDIPGLCPREPQEVNLGCADVLISLGQGQECRKGLGAVVFGGRFGSLAVAILQAM